MRILLLGVVGFAAVLGGLLFSGVLDQPASGRFGLSSSIGGDFRLTSQEGKPFDSRQLAGKPFALFFGFTQCPEVCPTTMLEVAEHMEKLGPLANRMNVVFVSVDPTRDTPEVLKDYLGHFDSRIIGLTGTEKEIADVASQYKAYYAKVKTEDDYTVDHSASVYLMDANGRLADTFTFQDPDDVKLKKLRAHASGKASGVS